MAIAARAVNENGNLIYCSSFLCREPVRCSRVKVRKLVQRTAGRPMPAVADLSDIADADAGIIICAIFAELRCVGLLCFCVLLSS
jgi:hypothetical protein